jgi:hypothetical protein
MFPFIQPRTMLDSVQESNKWYGRPLFDPDWWDMLYSRG